MKIIFEHESDSDRNQQGQYYKAKKKVIIETEAEEICEVLEDIAGALVAYGFHQQTVRNGFINRAEEYMEEK